jgi:DNA-binding IclR family transcriptional regulator
MKSRSQSAITVSEPTLQRICAEYLEMPGLQLTLKQAQRLWGLDAETCARSLDFLVARGFLARTARDSYARLTEGNIALPTLRMAKASIYRLPARGVDRARPS